MVEGETLLVLLLLGRCHHPATVLQSARKGAVSAKQTCASTSALLDHVEPRRIEPHDLKGRLGQKPRRQRWNHMEPHGNRIVSMRLASAKQACAGIWALLEPR